MLCQVTWVFLGCIVVHTHIFTLSHRHYSFRHARKRYLMSFLGKGVAFIAFNVVNKEYIRCSRARQPKLFPWVPAEALDRFKAASLNRGKVCYVCSFRVQHCIIRDIGCQIPNPLEGDGLVSVLHRSSAYRRRRAALISSHDTSGATDNCPVLAQSCRTSSVRIAMFRAPTRSAWSVYWQF